MVGGSVMFSYKFGVQTAMVLAATSLTEAAHLA